MSKIVSIHSYRGGTGKSNTSSNLASLVARQGYRVCVVDTDIQSPGVHVLFGFDENSIDHSLNDFLWGRLPIEKTVYDVTSVLEGQGTDRSKLFLLPSSTKASDIARVLREGYDVNLLNDGFQDLITKLDLDYLFIDTHPGLNEETLLSITISDILLLVLRPDQQDYQGTAVTVDVARKLEVPELYLVVNKAPTIFNFDQLRQKIQDVYDAPVVGVLPHSDEMMILASNGVFVLKYPDHELTQVVKGIVQYIL